MESKQTLGAKRVQTLLYLCVFVRQHVCESVPTLQET